MQTLDSRRYRPSQFTVLALLALVGTLPFWLTGLDTWVAGLFHHPGADDPWFAAREPLWLFFYQAAPLLIGLAAVGSLIVFGAGTIWARFARWRIHAAFLLTLTVLGPGLIVNGVLKDQWGRPRPHQTVELGGTLDYVPPLAVGQPGKGKSFPCGHCSAGYMLAAFFLIWRRRRPRLARLALAAAVVLGTLIGLSRMAAGDHFLSDVIWSAVIVYTLALILYHLVFRIPRHEDMARQAPSAPSRPLRHPVATAVGYGVVALLMVLGTLLATPVHENRSQEVIASAYQPPPRVLRLVADTAQITLVWHQWRERSALILLKGRGFGLPGTRVRDRLEVQDGVLTFSVRHQGVFTEKDTSLVVGVVPAAWDRIEVEIRSGDIRVYPVPPSAPQLDFRTADGKVLRDVS